MDQGDNYVLLLKVPLAQQGLHWYNWRIKHQTMAQKCHYKKRNATPP
jgi:hypothetical protein